LREHSSESDRPNHIWELAGRDHPHLVARRRAAPEVLNHGKAALAEILDAYARCLKFSVWPAFDPDTGELVEQWSEVHLEPRMTQCDGGRSTFFALEAASRAKLAA
jgi:hypothetical protein